MAKIANAGEAKEAKVSILNVTMPIVLRKRAHVIAKYFRMSTNQLVREGLSDRLEVLEAKQRAEETRVQNKREEKRNGRGLRTLEERVNEMAPPTPELLDESRAVVTTAPTDSIYAEHAKKILGAMASGNTIEKRLRVSEAITAIKKQHPLTHPSDSAILALLENALVVLQAAQPIQPISQMSSVTQHFSSNLSSPEPTREPTRALDILGARISRAFDELSGKTINPENIKSHGDLPSE